MANHISRLYDFKAGDTGRSQQIDDELNQIVNAINTNADGSESNLSTHTTRTDNPHVTTKAQVGLGNADNTSDANKPISTAQSTALAGKQATLVSGTNIKTVNGTSVLGSGDIAIGGSVAWGSVTGTLANQTDLNTALGGKEPTITGDAVTKFWSGTKTWRDLATDVRAVVLTGLSTATNALITATDTILVALGKLQAQISAKQDTLVSGTNIKTVNGVSLLGSGDIPVSGGGGGDMYKATYDTTNNGIVDRAETADKLTTARTINGVSFDGTADITVADGTKALATHAHGNVTTDGKIGSTSGLPIITGSAGLLQAGSFGTTSGTFCQGNDGRLAAETATTIGTLISGATAKATPADADLVPLTDSTASHIVRKLTWANVKSELATYFASLAQTLTNKTLTTPKMSIGVVAVTASKTLALTDATTLQDCNHATVAIVVTVPLNASVAFPIGTEIGIEQSGAAQVSVAATGGVTINPSTTLKINAINQAACLVKKGTDLWGLYGSLKA